MFQLKTIKGKKKILFSSCSLSILVQKKKQKLPYAKDNIEKLVIFIYSQ